MSDHALPACPYVGLVPYTEADAPFFFGRDSERDTIITNLLSSRLLLLYGPSGVGKSSVLRAGVVHALRAQIERNLAERNEPEFIVVYFNNWRDEPLAGLVAAVGAGLAPAPNGQPSAGQPSAGQPHGLKDHLGLPLHEILESVANQTNADLLIILDQFEEYFLYHANEDGAGTFFAEFPRAVNRAGLRANFLVSIREDALAKLDRFKGHIPSLFDNYLRIEHLDRDAAREAIEQPLAEYNRRLPAEAQPVSIEPALVEAVLAQVQTGQVVIGEQGRGVAHAAADDARIETPYLQLVLERLWKEDVETLHVTSLQLATLTRLHGAQGIVQTHLDTLMQGLSAAEQAICSSFFDRLVTPSGAKIAQTRDDLVQYSQQSEAAVTPVLTKLGDARILRPVAPPLDQPEATRYEIFHDVLAPALLDWRRRYEEGRERERFRQEEEARQAQARRAEQERREKFRLRVILIVGALLLVSFGGLAAYAFSQKADAETFRQLAFA
ncbi:MAG: AAA family ATPase, partial [Chloroflexota bacterium]